MWTDKETRILNAILEKLIPANPMRGIPSAGEINILGYITSQAEADLTLKNYISSLLGLAQSSSDGVTIDLVLRLETELPDAFNALLSETYKGYYSRPDMRSKFGVGAHPVHPKGYDVVPESAKFMDELTAPVLARGPIYRDPTGGQS